MTWRLPNWIRWLPRILCYVFGLHFRTMEAVFFVDSVGGYLNDYIQPGYSQRCPLTSPFRRRNRAVRAGRPHLVLRCKGEVIATYASTGAFVSEIRKDATEWLEKREQ